MTDEFELKLGISGAAGAGSDRRYLSRILKESGATFPRISTRRLYMGTRSGRGVVASRMLEMDDRYSGFRSRRAIVRTRIVKLGRNCSSPMRAHLAYLERDAVRAENEHGRLYSHSQDEVDGESFVLRSKGDRHQFRMVLSPEDGVNYDELRPLVRRFMGRVEGDLGTGLDWVAADHFNTLHPHAHVLLKGTDDRGGDLVISPLYLYPNLGRRLSDLVSIDLGPRTQFEISRLREMDVGAERLTELDQKLIQEKDPKGLVSQFAPETFDQAMRAGRLKKLAHLGLAKNLGNGRWQLAELMEPVLTELGNRAAARTLEKLDHLLRDAGAEISAETGLIFNPSDQRLAAEGTVRRSFLIGEARFALIGNDREFTLVPWQARFDHELDRSMADLMRPAHPLSSISRKGPELSL